MITIGNVKDMNKYGEETPIFIVDRTTIMGNPFIMKSEEDRNEVIQKYEVWLREKLDSKRDNPQKVVIEHMVEAYLEYGSIVLLCHCAPKKCHASIIKKIVRERLKSK